MSTFTIDWRCVKAAACAVAKTETRYYLNGVCMEHHADGPVFVGTDGHRLIATRHDWMEGETPEPFEPVILPLDLIKRVKVGKRMSDMVTVELTGSPVVVTVTTEVGDSAIEKAIEATFPGWRQILPREKASGKAAQYNADYLASFQAAMRALGVEGTSSAPRLAYNGANPTLVDLWHDNAFGVIMPMRAEQGIQEPPTWALRA